MLFLERSVDDPIGVRNNRFWAAHGGGSVTLPEIIVDSGHQVHNGYVADFYTTYKQLVDAELPRAPQAEVEAYSRRVGDTLRVYATFTNHCGTSLSRTANDATAHAIVWQDAKIGVTGRYVLAAPYQSITTAIANGASASFTFDTAAFTGVDWSKIHAVALIDYSPAGLYAGPYDMLQAAIAQPAAIVASPAQLLFNVSTTTPGTPSAQLSLKGPYVVNWTASSDAAWLSVSPATGTLPAYPTATVAPAHLVPGTQHGTVTITGTSADGLSLTTSIPLTANFTNQLPGDVNGDGAVGMGDVFFLVNYIFGAGSAPPGLADPNGDGVTNAADVIYLVNYLLAGGAPPQG